MDTIRIENLELWTHIGVTEEERSLEQRILVTVSIETDAKKVSISDDVSKGINYEDVAKRILELGKEKRKTLEKLAEDIASMVTDEYQATSAEVTVEKKVIPGTSGVTVTIERVKRQETRDNL
jgi:FolB domain-containing protein